MGTFLTISDVQGSDGGTYVCTASNRAGEVTARASLILISRSNLVIVPVAAFSSLSMAGDCHEFNTTQFEVRVSLFYAVRFLENMCI